MKKIAKRIMSFLLVFSIILTNVGVIPAQAEETEDLYRGLIPLPLNYEVNDGKWTLTETTQFYVEGRSEEETAELADVAGYLAEKLRASTGFSLAVNQGITTEAGNIIIKTDDAEEALGEEGYKIEVIDTGVTVIAYQPAGAFRAMQTLRQLLPAEAELQTAAEGVSWDMPCTSIEDKPEYSYRSSHLDVSRHFFTVEQVKRYIDHMAQYKMNKLHMHLTDDQGWRLEIKGEMYGESLSKLTEIGASSSSSINGVKAGYYTQEEFKEIVAYAAERYIEIIPEVDMPAHAWASLVSLNFLNSTEDGKPQASGYDNTKPYEGIDVGFASLECRNEKTYEFLDEVIRQISEISPSKYIHIGGDEAHSTSSSDYSYFVNRVTEIAQKYGKTPIAWQNYDTAVEDKENTITQFWSTGNAKFKTGVKYVVSPADHAYMDMKYDSSSEFGMTWAGMTSIQDAYEWDPTDHGAKEQVVGVEACIWTETISSDYGLDYMVYPRLAGHAEIGWTPKEMRNWNEYKVRLIAHGERLENQGIQFYKDEDIWTEPYVPVNAEWNMEEGTGNRISDTTGIYFGEIGGGVSWSEGQNGSGLAFNGSGYVDLGLKDLQGAWTASMWVKKGTCTEDNAVLLSGNEGEIKLEQYKNTKKVGITKFGVSDYTFDYIAPTGEWVLLTFVCDESKTYLYVNGELTDTLNAAIQAPAKRIGANDKAGLDSAGYLTGSLDEVKIFNRALAADEVEAIYAASKKTEDSDSISSYDIPVTAAQIRRMWCQTNYNTADYVYVDSFLGYGRVLYTRFYSSELQSDVTDKVVLTLEGRTRIPNEKVSMAAIALSDTQALKVEKSLNTSASALKITTEKTAATADKLMTTTSGKYVDAVKNSVVAYGSAVSSETAVTDNILNTFVYPVTIELDVTDIVKQAMASGDHVQFALLPAKDVMITDAENTVVNLGKLDNFGAYKNGVVYDVDGEILYENIPAASLDTSITVCGKAGYYDGTINETNDAYFSWIYPVKTSAKLKVWRQADEDIFANYAASVESAAELEESFADISYLFDDTLWADFEKVSGEEGIYPALYEALADADLSGFTQDFEKIVDEYKNNSIYDIPAAAVQLRRMWCQTNYNSGDYTYSNDFLGYGRTLYTRFYNDEVQSENAYRIVLSYEGRTRTANETVAVAVVAINDTQAKKVESTLTGSGSSFITASDKSTTTSQKLMTDTSGYYLNAVKDCVVAYGKATSAETAVTKNIHSNFVYPVTMEFDVTDAVKQALENGNHVQFALLPAKDIMIEDGNGTQMNLGKLTDFGRYEDGKVYAADGSVLYNIPTASLDTSAPVCGAADYYAANTLNTKDVYFDWIYPVVGSMKLTAWTRTKEESFAAYTAGVDSAQDVKATFADISYLFEDTLWVQFEKVSSEDGIYDVIYEAMKDSDLAGFTAAFEEIVHDFYWGGYTLRINTATDLGGRRGTLIIDGEAIPELAYAKAVIKGAEGGELEHEVLTVKDGTSYYNYYDVENANSIELVLFADEACSEQLSAAAIVKLEELNIPEVFITEISNQHARTYVSAGESWGSDEQPFQYIELYNYTDTAVDLSEYTFVYNDHVGTHEFAWIRETNGSLVLEPGDIYIIGVYSADSATNGYAYDTDEALAAYWDGFNDFYSTDISITNRVLIACVASGDANTMLDGINHLERSYDAGVSVSAEIRKGSETVTRVNLAEKKPGNSYAFYFAPSEGNTAEEKRLFLAGCFPGKLMAEQDVTYCEEVFLNSTDMLKVMSYNILATEKSASDNYTGLEIEEREDLLMEVLDNYQPDILGLQEVNYRWAPLLQADMPGAGYAEVQGYSSNGHTYANASGVWDLLNPIYYKADKFNLIESGAAYLTPDGNRTTKQWDTDNLKRTMTWVVLEDKETKEIVNFINNHLVTKGKVARVEQVKLLYTKGAELQEKYGGGLVITGDHNIYEGTEPYQVYVNSGVVSDSRYLTTNHTMISSTSYGGQSHDRAYGVPIDFVMVSPNQYFVNKYEIYEGIYPQGLVSDHSAVYVELYNRDVPDIPALTAEDVMEMINAIGPVSLESASKVEEAREAYEALLEEEKELVENYKVLTDAEAALKKLRASTNLFDQDSSDNWLKALSYQGSKLTNTTNYANIFTTHKIAAAAGDTLYWGSFGQEDYVMEVYGQNDTYLGQVMFKNITSYDLGIDVAGVKDDMRNQHLFEYTIPYSGAAYVRILGNISTMDSYQVYKNAEGGWAEILVHKIEAIGEVSLDKENAITEARLIYNALCEEQKALVTNYEVLTDAEAALELLKNPPIEFTIVKQPVDASAAQGGDAAVSVEATGEGLTYTWYYKNPGNKKFYLSGSEFVSEDGATYTIPMYAWRDGQEVYCVVTDVNGDTLQTNTVTLTMSQESGPIVIVEQPKDVTVISAYMHAAVNVKATGEGLTYTWYYKNPGNVKFYESGADFVNKNQYVIEVAPWRDGQQVYCVITDANGNRVQTNTVTLTVTK